MNYEELYAELQIIEKELKEKVNASQKLFKAIGVETEKGNLKELAKNIEALQQATTAQTEILERLSTTVESFDVKTYFESGQFAEQMLLLCKEQGVDVQVDTPVYEMFPYRVRIDTENQELYLDRKKLQCVRPLSFVNTVKSSKDRLMKASFNAQVFLNELAEAYDVALLKQGKESGADLYLTGLYKVLAPMSRFRKDYDQQSFAFDLARLYASEVEETKNGRKFQFGPSRNNSKAIRILDAEGKEQFLATIRFF